MEDDNEEADLRGPAIIAIGGVVGGFEFYGPYESIDAALQATKQMVVIPSLTIALLTPPKRLPFLKPDQAE